jgi:hypothetical protein
MTLDGERTGNKYLDLIGKHGLFQLNLFLKELAMELNTNNVK